jgi:hypothetical protein
MDQLSLFDGHARASDPATSHEAAPDGVHLSRQCGLVLDAVETLHHWHSRGATAWEVVSYLNDGTQQSVAARRLTDLRDLGLVVEGGSRPGMTGRRLIAWYPKAPPVT